MNRRKVQNTSSSTTSSKLCIDDLAPEVEMSYEEDVAEVATATSSQQIQTYKKCDSRAPMSRHINMPSLVLIIILLFCAASTTRGDTANVRTSNEI